MKSVVSLSAAVNVANVRYLPQILHISLAHPFIVRNGEVTTWACS